MMLSSEQFAEYYPRGPAESKTIRDFAFERYQELLDDHDLLQNKTKFLSRMTNINNQILGHPSSKKTEILDSNLMTIVGPPILSQSSSSRSLVSEDMKIPSNVSLAKMKKLRESFEAPERLGAGAPFVSFSSRRSSSTDLREDGASRNLDSQINPRPFKPTSSSSVQSKIIASSPTRSISPKRNRAASGIPLERENRPSKLKPAKTNAETMTSIESTNEISEQPNVIIPSTVFPNPSPPPLLSLDEDLCDAVVHDRDDKESVIQTFEKNKQFAKVVPIPENAEIEDDEEEQEGDDLDVVEQDEDVTREPGDKVDNEEIYVGEYKSSVRFDELKEDDLKQVEDRFVENELQIQSSVGSQIVENNGSSFSLPLSQSLKPKIFEQDYSYGNRSLLSRPEISIKGSIQQSNYDEDVLVQKDSRRFASDLPASFTSNEDVLVQKDSRRFASDLPASFTSNSSLDQLNSRFNYSLSNRENDFNGSNFPPYIMGMSEEDWENSLFNERRRSKLLTEVNQTIPRKYSKLFPDQTLSKAESTSPMPSIHIHLPSLQQGPSNDVNRNSLTSSYVKQPLKYGFGGYDSLSESVDLSGLSLKRIRELTGLER